MTGQFTNKSVENTYVKEAYKLLGKLYDYSFVQQTLVQEAEKEERKKGFNMEAFSLGRYARSARRATTDASGRAGKEIVALYGDHQAPAAPVAARGVTPSLRRGSAPSRQIEDLSAEDIEFA
jgi:hypothetical protein